MNLYLARVLKYLVPLVISVALLYFTFREIDLQYVFERVQNVKGLYIFLVVLATVLGQWLRSLRWGMMLFPIERLSQRVLFPITSVGFMFLVLLPARLGELVRPYLLSQVSQVHMSAGIATVVLERIMDLLVMLALLLVMVNLLDLPGWIIQGASYFIMTGLGFIVFLLLGRAKISKIRELIRAWAPHKVSGFLIVFLDKFYEGMSVLRSQRHTLTVFLLTVFIWSNFVLSYFLLFRAFDMPLGGLAAITVLVITALGISVPAGPGFIGNFHFFCALALSLFGIEKELAVSYAVLAHLNMMITFSVLGIVCMNLSGLKTGFNFIKRTPV